MATKGEIRCNGKIYPLGNIRESSKLKLGEIYVYSDYNKTRMILDKKGVIHSFI